MGSPSPQLRAAGVSILAALVNPAPALVVDLLPRLVQLSSDSWWQVSLALVQVCCGLLHQLRAAAGEEGIASAVQAAEEAVAGGSSSSGAAGSAGSAGSAAAAGSSGYPYAQAVTHCLTILDAVLSPGRRASPLVSQAFVTSAAPLIDTYTSLRQHYVDAVLDLPPSAREALLGVNAWGEFVGSSGSSSSSSSSITLPLPGPSGAPIHLHSVGTALPYQAIVAQVHASVQEASLSYLDVAHFQLLLAATGSALAAVGEGGGGEAAAKGSSSAPSLTLPPEFALLASYKGLRDHIFVGICDTNCCAPALALLRLLVLCLPSGSGEGGLDLLQAPTMQGSLFLLHCPQSGEANPTLKEAVAVFLLEIAGAGQQHARAVAAFLAEWAARYPQAMQGSPLKGVLERINEQL